MDIATTAKAGTADDFLGDEYEDKDNEFMRQDAERRRRNAIKARRAVRDEAEG